MEKVIALYKSLGLTPVQLIEQFRLATPEYAQETISFAGRLDPMAEGVLLLLVGDENKNRQVYLNLEKEYQFEVLFGVATDTFDLLGLVVNQSLSEIDVRQLGEVVQRLVGTALQPYPPYSSKHVQGKALFDWAKQGRLVEIEIPAMPRTVFAAELLETYMVEKEELRQRLNDTVPLVTGAFRQPEILKQWERILAEDNRQAYGVAKIKAAVSSGTYVRSLADMIGRQVGSCGMALSIKRTRVGRFLESDCIRL